MVKVAINGFGRIGRLVYRAGHEDPDIEFVAINDLSSPEVLANLLRYDSTHGKFSGKIETAKDALIVNDKSIKLFAEKDPAQLPWKELGIDVVVESTGRFLTRELATKHLEAGAKKVLLSADAKTPDIKTIIKGVNEHTYDVNKDHIVSNASCTSNCSAPMVKVINDNFGIEHAFFTTTHAYTTTQKLQDMADKNPRNARAAAINIIPHPSGAAIAVPRAIPDIEGIFDGIALRVPIADGSITVLTAVVKKQTNVKEINDLFKNVAKNHLKGVLEYSEEPFVSSDIVGNAHSCIVDAEFTKANGKLIQVVGWYDNEWGYSCRMIDVLKIM